MSSENRLYTKKQPPLKPAHRACIRRSCLEVRARVPQGATDGGKKSLSVFFIGCCCCPSLHTQVSLSLRCTEVQPCRNTCTHVSSVALNIRKWGAACLKPNLQHVSTFALPPQLFVYCHTSPLTHHMHTHIQRNLLLTVDSDVFLQAITDVTC